MGKKPIPINIYKQISSLNTYFIPNAIEKAL